MATKTLEITNFSGRLTRIQNGDLNSGFAKFTTSFGYDPFSKPMNLTWMEVAGNISGTSDLILDGKVRFIGESFPTAYLIGDSGNLYNVQISSNSNAQLNSVVGVFSVLAGSPTYNKGASMEFFGNEPKIYIGSDGRINSINFDGTADAALGTAGNYFQNSFRPLKNFVGKLIFGNGTTVGAISATGTITSSVVGISSTISIYSELIPPLPNSVRIKDIDVSPDNNYLLMASTEVGYENISNITPPTLANTVPGESKVVYWNGVNQAPTAANTLSTTQISTLQTYLQKNHFFTADSLGTGLNRETEKVLTLANNKPPFTNAVGVNGNFLFWSSVEKETLSSGTNRLIHSMYYYGSLDQENPPGLYRILRQSAALASGNVVQLPFNRLVETASPDINTALTSVISAGIGTHYFSSYEVNSSSVLSAFRFLNVPPRGTGTSQGGVYETQNQLFSKRIGISQIRVYCEPTVANNSFQLDIIGGDGSVITNGTFTYDFVAGSDTTKMQGSLERINFNPNCKTLYSFGIRVTNNGSTNMTIKKIEVDYSEEGK